MSSRPQRQVSVNGFRSETRVVPHFVPRLDLNEPGDRKHHLRQVQITQPGLNFRQSPITASVCRLPVGHARSLSLQRFITDRRNASTPRQKPARVAGCDLFHSSISIDSRRNAEQTQRVTRQRNLLRQDETWLHGRCVFSPVCESLTSSGYFSIGVSTYGDCGVRGCFQKPGLSQISFCPS